MSVYRTTYAITRKCNETPQARSWAILSDHQIKGYDSNLLEREADELGVQLLTPRTIQALGLGVIKPQTQELLLPWPSVLPATCQKGFFTPGEATLR